MKTWCIPPKANADFVYHMEDVLRVYQLPYDRHYPVVCMDEASKQLIGEVNAPLPLRSGRVKCEDYELTPTGKPPPLAVRLAKALPFRRA